MESAGHLPPPLRRGPVPWLATAVLWLCAALPVLLSAGLVGFTIAGLWSAEGLWRAPVGWGRLLETPALVGSIVGSVGLVLACVVVAVPLGMGVALHLEGSRGLVRSLLSLNVASLAAVPGVILGLVGFELFARALHAGRGMVEAALVLALVVLPIVTMAARAALLGVPGELREAGCALGGTRWQVTRHVVIPAALPRIVSGSILAITRALGEAAALLLVAGLALPSYPAALDHSGPAPTLRLFVVLTDASAEGRGEALIGMLLMLCAALGLSAWAVGLRRRNERPREGD